MAYEVPMDNVNPTLPKDPVLVPRPRPGTVPLAVTLMVGGSLLGVVSAVALFVAAGTVPSVFAAGARSTEASGAQIESAVSVIRSSFLGTAVVTLLLALLMGTLAYPVLRGNVVARFATVALAAAALCTGLATASYTALGRNADWTANLDDANERVVAQIGQAYSDAMPTWFVGLAGGLTDLQALSYIAVAVLLLVPATHAYYRRRPAEPGSG